MNGKLFWIGFVLILIFAFVLRVLPTRDNNFYFTMDQGNDAVFIREIFVRKQPVLLGPETNIGGVFAGPGWYYFQAIGYALFGGHPFGGVFMVIMLNVALTAILMLIVRKEISPAYGLITGALLQTSWWFYDTSRYAFNPFPLMFVATCLVLSLCAFLRGRKKFYVLGAVLIGLGFHAEVAGSAALLLFYLIVGVYGLMTKKLSLRLFLVSIAVVLLFFIPHGISELSTHFSQTRIFLNEFQNPEGTFADSAHRRVTNYVFRAVARSIVRQVPLASSITFALLVMYTVIRWLRGQSVNRLAAHFLLLTLILVAVTWIFFSSNNGWRDWHTVYVSPLIFVSLILLTSTLPRWLAVGILCISLISHGVVFQRRYVANFRPTDDPSILHNELAAIDWVYTHAEGKGFSEYNYLPSVYDYPYQYLFWWHGRKQYGYLPCEFSSYPGSPKLIVPGQPAYEQPKRPCTNLRFFIIEPDEHADVRQQWLDGVQKGTRLVDHAMIGKILVEKRMVEE